MKKTLVAAVVVIAGSSPAWAVDTPLPNGSFEVPAASGFSQTITNWTVSFSGPAGATQPNGLPTSEHSGLFTTFGKFAFAPNGLQYVLIDNLGTGTTTLASGALGVNFQVTDRFLQFRYSYLSNDGPTAATHDEFRVHIDFFTTATGTTAIAGQSIDLLVADRGTFTDSATGFSPFGGLSNGATFTYNNTQGTTFGLVNIGIEQQFGNFARVSFIVNNSGVAAGTNGNGLGVSGVLLDNVVLNPEPSTLALFAAGIAGLGGLAWRRRSAAKNGSEKPRSAASHCRS